MRDNVFKGNAVKDVPGQRRTTAAAGSPSGARTSTPRASTPASRATRWPAMRPLLSFDSEGGGLFFVERRRALGRASSTRSPGTPVGAGGQGGGHLRRCGGRPAHRSSSPRPRWRATPSVRGRAVRRHRRRPPGRPTPLELDRLQQPAAGHRRLRHLRHPVQRRLHDRRGARSRGTGQHLRRPEARRRRRTSIRQS